MRILHVNNIANVGTILVHGLQELGYDANFYDLARPGSKASYPIKALISPLRFLEYAKLNSYIKHNSFDIVHIHFASQGIAGVLGRYPYFLHVHGSDVHKNLQIPIISQITRLALKKAEFVYYSTPNLEGFVRPIRNDAIYLPNPLLPIIKTESIPEIDSKRTRILLFMRLDPIKISDEFLLPLSKLARRNEIEIHAIRWGTMAKWVEKEYPTIQFIPMVPHNEIFHLLSRYDIVIGQLNQGALGMSEFEGMLAGKPVIANFNYPDAYIEQPPVLPANTVEEYLLNLEDLINNPEKRTQWGNLGRAWVTRNHDLEMISKTLICAYRQAIERRR
jgi:glycosyltransferase involved in cell wall biosynthesis